MLTVSRERKSARFVCRGTDYLEIGHLIPDFDYYLEKPDVKHQ